MSWELLIFVPRNYVKGRERLEPTHYPLLATHYCFVNREVDP